MILKCLVVDDEKPARELLAEYIGKMPELELIQTCSNAIDAQAVLRKTPADVLFLDIRMPNLSGLDFLRTLKNPPLVVLTTAYSEYALEAFELEVVDYLLKPVVFERFFEAVNKIFNRVGRQLPTGMTDTETPPREDFFFVKADGVIHKIDFEEVLYIESLREYIRLHTRDKRLVLRQSLSDLDQKLPENRFFRIHRSFIINPEHLEKIEGNQVFISGRALPLSKRRKELFLQYIQNKGLIG
ncbi:MAG: DNA-binding response regulator [Bacteroidetes bacterium]|nr:MAG: DNA-binding response regulator [Bacteroidota bacterium]